MESITIELCTSEGDPYDRTFGCLVRSGKTLLMARSLRVSPPITTGRLLIEIDRLVLAWAIPQINDSEHLHDTWDRTEAAIGYGPFDDPR